ncbi:hypothetical protein KW798_02800 [Candidatus Parcubacteria bacterium]|nr:hypothetical protein [Candidatus Parcubacteria bacterium]
MPIRIGSFVSQLLILCGIIAALVSFATLFAKAEVGPDINLTIHNSAHASTSQASIGSAIHAKAVVATTTGGATPTGTVDFNLYPNTSCSGSPSTQTVTLVNGSAESATTSVGNNGLSYTARYNGDATNTPSQSGCIALTATAVNTSISTDLSSSSIKVGTAVFDTAVLNNKTTDAGGTVTYKVYTNTSCTQNAQNAGVKTVSNGSVPNSDSITFNNVGTFYWQAAYSGDTHNEPATSTCSSERLTVQATSTNHHHDNEDGDDDDDDNDHDNHATSTNNGKHNGWVNGLPFGIFKKLQDVDFPGFNQKFFKNLFGNDNDDSNDDDEDSAKIKADKVKKWAESRGRDRAPRADRNDD